MHLILMILIKKRVIQGEENKADKEIIRFQAEKDFQAIEIDITEEVTKKVLVGKKIEKEAFSETVNKAEDNMIIIGHKLSTKEETSKIREDQVVKETVKN